MNCSYHYEFTYRKTLEQFDPNQHYQFGEKATILLLTDRLMGYADGIHKFLSLHQDLTVYQARSLEEVNQTLSQCTPDILLIIGCLAHFELYDAINLVKEANPYVCSVLYARTDDCTDAHMRDYHIEFLFHRDQPLDKLPVFLKEVLDQKLIKKSQYIQKTAVPEQAELQKSKHKIKGFRRLFTYLHLHKKVVI